MDPECQQVVLATKPSPSAIRSSLKHQVAAAQPQPGTHSQALLPSFVPSKSVAGSGPTAAPGAQNDDRAPGIAAFVEIDSARVLSSNEAQSPAATEAYAQEPRGFSTATGGGAALALPGAAQACDQAGPFQDLGFAVGEAVDRLRKVRVRIRLGPAGRRLLSGAIAGGVSRTVVAPLETIRTHLMVGSTRQKSVVGVCKWIVASEGWTGLFRGNGINVLRVAPSKAIELFTYDTVKKALTKDEADKVPGLLRPFPVSSIAGSCAGIASCTLTYPLELVKTRLTVQKGAYNGISDAFMKIVHQEGVLGLYRGLFASIVGVIPYAGANYFAYDTLRTLYKRVTKKKQIGHLATLVIGSCAGAFAASATFPLEVARKQMQMGSLNGRVVYKNTIDCMLGILREQGPQGLYRGLAPSCIKLVPAAGISFMCYEALKRVLLDENKIEEQPSKGPV